MSVYTPATNPYLFGFDDLIKVFMTQKMPHSVLLYGPKGIGKMTFAYHLARYLFQEQPSQFHVDINSPLYAQVAQGSYEGLKVVERGFNALEKRTRDITIDSIHKMVQFLHTTSISGGWRVVIIDSVDELNYKAANALLKTLEEPPQKSLIILIAHSLGRVLPTLKSRCQQYSKNFLGKRDMDNVLLHLLPNISHDQHNLLHQYAMGCPGRMISLVALGGEEFYRDFLNVANHIAIGNLVPALVFIEKLQSLEDSDVIHEYFGEFFSWWLGRLLSWKKGDENIFSQEDAVFNKLREKQTFVFWLDFWQHVTTLMAQIRSHSLDRRHVLTSLFYEMAAGKLSFSD